MLDTVPWFGFVPHYQSQLAGGTQLHAVYVQPGVVPQFATEGSSGVTLLYLVSTAFFAYFTHTHTHTRMQVNTHYTVVVWSDKGVVTGGQRVTEGVWPSAEATAPSLPLSCLRNKCDRLIPAQKEQLQGVV